MRSVSYPDKPTVRFITALRIPSQRLEYVYYCALVYVVLSPAFDLSLPFLGGGLMLIISALCIQELRAAAKQIYAPIALLLACVTSFLLIQIFAHGVSVSGDVIRPYINWMLGLIIVHSLCLRPGFRFRYSLVLFFIGVTTIPFLGFTTGAVDMARVELAVQGGLTHPGGLAEWFGFCAICFAIDGLRSPRTLYRIGAWLLAVGCLLVVTLTVERGPLFAAVLAITTGFRGVLKRGFAPVFALVIIAGVVYTSGIFEHAISQYSERSLEETGRGILWPAAIELIVASPLVGIGESNVNIKPWPITRAQPPHNAFLHLALASGIVPFAFFVAFWIKSAWKSLPHFGSTDPYRDAYLCFTFTIAMLSDYGFLSPFCLLTFSVVAGSVASSKQKRFLHIGNAHGRAVVPVEKTHIRPRKMISHRGN